MFGWLTDPAAWIGLLTLTALEIVLGIDNIVFISILASKLPPQDRERARKTGLSLALFTRILLVMSVGTVAKLTKPLFTLPIATLSAETREVSGRDIILLVGGLFLIYKSTKEIHQKLEGSDEEHSVKGAPKFAAVIVQILLLDIIFSLDSVITAVGMVSQIPVMIAAVVISVAFMFFFSGKIAKFVEDHPTIKVLALSFLVLIGANLLAEGCGQSIPKGYTYFAMAFAVCVEMLNLKVRKSSPVKLHKSPYDPE